MKRPLLAIATLSLLVTSVAQSASATTTTFLASMVGSNENPANTSTATGFTAAIFDTTANTLTVEVTFDGLLGGAGSAAHIHCCIAPNGNASVAVPFIGFPAAISGSYSNVFNLLDPFTYTASFLTSGGGTAAGAESALLAGLLAGDAYSNIHDVQFPGGEIRGFLAQQVPEPASVALFGAAVAGIAARRRRKAKKA